MPVPVVPRRSITIADPIAVANAFKTSVATSASPASYSGVALNGATGVAALAQTRTVSFTSTSSAGSYVAGSKVTFTGTDENNRVIAEILLNSTANGNETVVGAQGFKTVTQIDVEAQANTSGAFTFGYRDVVCPGCTSIRFGGTGNALVGWPDSSSDTLPTLLAGELVRGNFQKLFGSATTTATKITLFF